MEEPKFESKFKPGDRVRVINYGAIFHVMGGDEAIPKEWPILAIQDGITYVDPLSEIIGKEGTVIGSYHDLYGGEQEGSYKDYHVTGIPEKCSWYHEGQLELIGHGATGDKTNTERDPG